MFAVNMLMARYATFVPPNALALGRWLGVALLLLPFVWPRLVRDRHALSREWPDLLLLGALGMWICGAWVYIGGRTAPALNIGLIYAASPILVVALGRLLYRERLTAGRLAGIALCLAGVAAVFAKGRIGNLLSVEFTEGDLWIAAASACWGVYSVLLKHRPSALDPLTRLCAIAFAGSLVLLPFAVGEAVLWHGPDFTDWRTWVSSRRRRLRRLRLLHPRARSLGHQRVDVSRPALCRHPRLDHLGRSAAVVPFRRHGPRAARPVPGHAFTRQRSLTCLVLFSR